MNVWEILLLSAALSADSFGIGVSFAARGIRVPVISAMAICLISAVVTAAAAAAGNTVAGYVPAGAGRFIGSVMLAALGIYIIAGTVKKNSTGSESENGIGRTARILTSPSAGDADHSNNIDLKEACYIGAALSLDSLAAGLGAGMSGAGMAVPALCGIFQLVFLRCGQLAGLALKEKSCANEKIMTILSGVVLIITAAAKSAF